MPGQVKSTIVLTVILQILLRPCKCLCYKSYKRLFAFTLISGILIFLLNTIPRQQEYPSVTAPPPDIAEIMQRSPDVPEQPVPELSQFERNLLRVPAHFVQLAKCPSCLGRDLCNAIEAETLRIEIPPNPTNMSKNGMYFGIKGNALVLVKVYADDNAFRKYDAHVCKDAVGRTECPVGKDILQSFVVKDETYLPRNIKKAYKIVHDQPEDLANVICVTESMLDNFIEAIDPGPGDVGPDDRALLYTSTIVHPEVVNFRFLSRTEVAWAFPHFVGACGRLIVLDHFGKPLLSFINEPWDTRADLALQILHIIDAFIKGDEAWFIMYHGFEFDNFHVTDDYRVVVVNAHDIGFVDRDAAGEADPADDGRACNEECFEKYLHELYDIKMPLQELTCNKATSIMSNYMYSLACRDILSDLPEHKHTTDRSADKKHPGRGLLHDIPAAHYEGLNEALMECVTENSPNGRHQAVEELLEILNHYSADAKQLDFVLPGKRKQAINNHKITL